MQSIGVFRVAAGLFLASVLPASPIRVGVSVLPLESVVRDIGGDHVQVRSLQETGDSCSVFEPRPSGISWMARADLFFRTGTAYETVILDKFAKRFQNLKVLDLRDSVKVIRQGNEEHAHEHLHEETPQTLELDPHIWLDPVRLHSMADFIATHLSEALPEAADEIAGQAAAFKERTREVDERLRELLGPHAGRAFYIYHPSLGYFSERYGLRQIPIISTGQSPSGRDLHRSIRHAREEGIKVIFVQPQESRKQAEIIAGSIGAGIIEIDPMDKQWDTNLLRIGEALAAALSE